MRFCSDLVIIHHQPSYFVVTGDTPHTLNSSLYLQVPLCSPAVHLGSDAVSWILKSAKSLQLPDIKTRADALQLGTRLPME